MDYEIDYCDECGGVIPRGFGYLCEGCLNERDGWYEQEKDEDPPSYW